MLKNREARNLYLKQYRLKNLEKDKLAKKKYYEKTKDKFREREKKWRQENPDKSYDTALKYKYGITLEFVNKLKVKQNNKCKLCEKETKLLVDHCHTTGKIRGLLCNKCNVALGSFKDNIEVLQKAIDYLKQTNDLRDEINYENK